VINKVQINEFELPVRVFDMVQAAREVARDYATWGGDVESSIHLAHVEDLGDDVRDPEEFGVRADDTHVWMVYVGGYYVEPKGLQIRF
jgi:hypothetical protein